MVNIYLSAVLPVLGAIVNLSTPGDYISFGVISISVANFVVVVVMTVIFIAAVFLPFPHRKEEGK